MAINYFDTSEREAIIRYNTTEEIDAFREGALWCSTKKDEQYKRIVDSLIDILETSKNYHLGITGLDSEEEIIKKRKYGETALIRNIEQKIKMAKKEIGE